MVRNRPSLSGTDFRDRYLLVSVNVARMVETCVRSMGLSGKRNINNAAVANRLDSETPWAKKN
jgi:hypothetical protein